MQEQVCNNCHMVPVYKLAKQNGAYALLNCDGDVVEIYGENRAEAIAQALVDIVEDCATEGDSIFTFNMETN